MEEPHLKAGPLTLEVRKGESIARLVESEFPQYLLLTADKLESMEAAHQAVRVVDRIRITLLNGWAVYLILQTRANDCYLELVESEMIDA